MKQLLLSLGAMVLLNLNAIAQFNFEVIKRLDPQFTSNIQWLSKLNNNIIFFGVTEENGFELWKSDGTSEGTNILFDYNEGPGNSYPYYFLPATNHTYIIYYDTNSDTTIIDVAITDGTIEGTAVIADVADFFTSSTETIFFLDALVLNEELYFLRSTYSLGTNSTPTTLGLYKFDIEAATFSLELDLLQFGDRLYDYNKYGGKFFSFTMQSNGQYSTYITDGTQQGTTLLTTNQFYADNVVQINGEYFLLAYDTNNYRYFWLKWNALNDFSPIIEDNSLINYVGYSMLFHNNKLFFTGSSNDYGLELYSFDGVNVTRITDIAVGHNDSEIESIFVYQDRIGVLAKDNYSPYHHVYLMTETGEEIEKIIIDNFPSYVNGIIGNDFNELNGDIIFYGSYSYNFTDQQLCKLSRNYASISTSDLKDVVIYPNPSNGQMTVNFGQYISNATITIVDITGRTVFNETVGFADQLQLNLDVNPGLYMVNILSEEGNSLTPIQVK